MAASSRLKRFRGSERDDEMEKLVKLFANSLKLIFPPSPMRRRKEKLILNRYRNGFYSLLKATRDFHRFGERREDFMELMEIFFVICRRRNSFRENVTL